MAPAEWVSYELWLFVRQKAVTGVIVDSQRALRELYYSSVFMSSFTHHRRRQTLVQICSSSVVMISTFRSQGEAACSCQTFPNIFCLDLKSFSSPHTNSLSHTHTHILSLALPISYSHAHNKCGWNVWCGHDAAQASPAPFSTKSPWFRICFYSLVWQGQYSRLTRKNLSQTCHVFPGGGM